MNKRLWIGCSVLVVMALLLVGCQGRPTAKEIVARVQEVEASTQDAHAVLEIAIQDPSRDVDMTVEVWESGNQFRAELLESSSPEAPVGSVIVNDGQQVWIYDPAQNKVRVSEVEASQPEGPLANPREMVQLVDEAIQWVLDRSEVKLAGEQDVAGVPTYKLEFEPKEGQDLPFAAASQGTLWVDQERWIILQARLVIEGIAESSMLVRSFELNPGIPDEVFSFEVPQGATVQEFEPQRTEHLTLDDAQAMAKSLLIPTYIPEGVTLIDVLAVKDAFALHYDHSDTSFTIVQGPTPAVGNSLPVGERPLGQTSEVTVRGQTATLIADPGQGNRFLTWQENDVTIIIAGHISQDNLLKVAESLQ
jgi:outer membrane lipoprotein-sorting protein